MSLVMPFSFIRALGMIYLGSQVVGQPWFDSVTELLMLSTCHQHAPGAWGDSHSLVARQNCIARLTVGYKHQDRCFRLGLCHLSCLV